MKCKITQKNVIIVKERIMWVHTSFLLGLSMVKNQWKFPPMSFVSCSESDSQDDPEPLDDEESNANITVGHLHRNI